MIEEHASHLPGLEHLTCVELAQLGHNSKFRKVFLSELSRRNCTHKTNGHERFGAFEHKAVAPERAWAVKIILPPGEAKASPATQVQRDRFRKSLTPIQRREYSEYLDIRLPEIEASDAEKRQFNLLAANRARLQGQQESGTGITGGGKKGGRKSHLPPEIIELAGRKELSVTSASGAGIRSRQPVDRGAPLQLDGIKRRVAELWQAGLPISLRQRRLRPAGCILDILKEENPGMEFYVSEIRNLVKSAQCAIKMSIKKGTNNDKPDGNN